MNDGKTIEQIVNFIEKVVNFVEILIKFVEITRDFVDKRKRAALSRNRLLITMGLNTLISSTPQSIYDLRVVEKNESVYTQNIHTIVRDWNIFHVIVRMLS
jgi:hypothetical protein